MEQFYLEYLVFDQATKIDTFHTELALWYLNTLRTLLGSGDFAGVSSHSPGTESGQVGTLRTKLLTLLKQSTLYNAFEVLQYIINAANQMKSSTTKPTSSSSSSSSSSDRINTHLFDELVILYTRVCIFTFIFRSTECVFVVC
jgi:hypothetical protein